MKKILFCFLIVCLTGSSPFALAEEFRTFTNSAGVKIQAKVKSISDGKVTIVMSNNKEFSIPVTTLSPADQEFLKTWKATPAATPDSTPAKLEPTGGVDVAAINEVIGQELFSDTLLWSSSAEETAGRLKWRRESKTEFSESYRAYPNKDYRFLGARPFSAALYGENENITGISIVFANKGDSFGSKGGGEEHFIKGKPVPGGMEGLKIIMENDAELIAKALTEKLGEPKKQKFGDGESRVNVERWDWAGHAFLLSNVEEEYVSLAIQTVEFADDRGKSGRVPDAVIRKRIRANVEKRDNGDVVISNIPMVDQGPKGYCAPATVERCMRTFGIPADMYLLAMAGETKAGGGTSVDRLLSNVGRDIKRKGRSFDIYNGELKLREIKKQIDGGVPVMWTLFSTKQFNETANARTADRKEKKWADYKTEVETAAEKNELVKDTSTAHIVIIIGYNEDSKEIAFSDSWGERYKERWITIQEAEQISQQRFYVIDL